MSGIEDLLTHIDIKKSGEISVDKYINDLLISTIKDIKRVEHSKSVANLCYKIALANKLNNSISFFIAGLLHDLAKGLDKDLMKSYMVKYFKEYLDMPKYAYHQFVATILVKELFNIDDAEILDAIEYHCTGKKDMSPLGKIVYASDKVDPLRGYDSSDMIKSLLSNYEDGFIYVLRENRDFIFKKINEKHSVDNWLTEECFKEYLGD